MRKTEGGGQPGGGDLKEDNMEEFSLKESIKFEEKEGTLKEGIRMRYGHKHISKIILKNPRPITCEDIIP